jgi:hypothetical protein
MRLVSSGADRTGVITRARVTALIAIMTLVTVVAPLVGQSGKKSDDRTAAPAPVLSLVGAGLLLPQRTRLA